MKLRFKDNPENCINAHDPHQKIGEWQSEIHPSIVRLLS